MFGIQGKFLGHFGTPENGRFATLKPIVEYFTQLSQGGLDSSQEEQILGPRDELVGLKHKNTDTPEESFFHMKKIFCDVTQQLRHATEYLRHVLRRSDDVTQGPSGVTPCPGDMTQWLRHATKSFHGVMQLFFHMKK
ncbi:MAG: hypothetical protein RBS35_07500 [Azonexus sp.]|jgi:hypothetical protein|nr:hypothetical protein [Azonexus sp.]